MDTVVKYNNCDGYNCKGLYLAQSNEIRLNAII